MYLMMNLLVKWHTLNTLQQKHEPYGAESGNYKSTGTV